ncbi:MAG: methyltransferase domain-containing protein [Nodularia sp. (in: Bacteria)]|nr:MAG: methyltransferase domain-containing protein [Nodularia sp. (in: cyanobacteria)]
MVDHNETYGRHILQKTIKEIDISQCLDLGCGNGDDLTIIKQYNPQAKLIGIDHSSSSTNKLVNKGIHSISVNIENQALPFDDESVDFIIANQILEHTKEIFWINHEIFRTLRVGGYLYLGVPNVLSLHNRILGLFGIHPTCSKLISAHVRVFSKQDTLMFYRSIAQRFATVDKFYGSQFYPFPKKIARPLSAVLPSLAFSIFFVIRKTEKYNGEFIEWLIKTPLETNFYRGE